MRKPKEQVDDDSNEAQFFADDFEPGSFIEQDNDAGSLDPQQRKRPARQRVELRNEQQTLRRQLSDWGDYEQDDFDTKI